MKAKLAMLRGAAALVVMWAAYARVAEATCQPSSWCNWGLGRDACEYLESDELGENTHCDMNDLGECSSGTGLICSHPN
jgi:hypothetical protein